MWAWWVTVALAGDRWQGLEGDLHATADVAVSTTDVTAIFADVPRAAKLFDASCADHWRFAFPGTPAAPPEVVWSPSWVHRKLKVVVDAQRPGQRVTWDLEGRKGNQGFYLVVDVVPREGGSTVTLSTPLDPPGWPLRRLFFRTIRPAWAACYAAVLGHLDPDGEVTSLTGAEQPRAR
jgi:hypothetical protein